MRSNGYWSSASHDHDHHIPEKSPGLGHGHAPGLGPGAHPLLVVTSNGFLLG